MKIFKNLFLSLILIASLLQAGDINVWGHAGISSQWQLSGKNNKNYSGVSASIGFDAVFSNGISFGFGAWGAYPVYRQNNVEKNIYRSYGIISDLYFAYSDINYQMAIGRYDTSNLKYEWFSGYNEGLSISANILDFMKIWGLYSYEQTLQFRKTNRETYGQINALWNYDKHSSNIDSKRDEHLIAFGFDFTISEYFHFSPYAYFVTNNFGATGFTSNLIFGDTSKFYSNTMFKYTFLDSFKGPKLLGQLFLIDQEFGYDWFKFGGGYYKTLQDGVQALTYYGDTSRFYGSVITPNNDNKASGEYFGTNQSTWYVFLGARHKRFKIDILYAGGGYKELSVLASIILFNHLEFGGGYVDLANIGDNKRNYLTAFIKAVW
ncbi:hypothetical protein [Helicobacter sp. MIT 14-3879]|uniref:hypothetical protein n=1 Tax=Helicobacter sp. MIT 14-3879 TaxID=2040649 RepID=UPI000E1F7ACA|nr:hypothetical protein [Helicobacter sp. MIT 14-3879]RDU63132.1 hypothetical protein CQA44_05695 [Helicobacter sp. MIT 14-3879]